MSLSEDITKLRPLVRKVEAYEPGGLIGQDFTQFRAMRDLASAVDALVKTIKEDRDAFERTLYYRMEDEDVDSQKSGGFLFSRPEHPTVYAQIQDKTRFIAWAKKHDPDLVRDEPRKGDLNTLVRQRLDDNQGLPPGIGWYDDKGISVRKAPGKK